jgi:hypothetical protein
LQVTALPGIDLGALAAGVPGLVASSGPYAGVATALRHGRRETGVWVERRPRPRSAVDRPVLLTGTWAHRGLVLERGLARRLGVRAGTRVRVSTTRGDVTMPVDGVALTASPHRPGTDGVAYAGQGVVRTISPRLRVQGTTMMLELDSNAGTVAAAALAGRYPAHAIAVAQPGRDRCMEDVD